MILKDDVINAYKFLLGRDPESAKTIKNYSKEASIQSLRRKLILSPEFSNKYSLMRNENNYSHVNKADIECEKYIFMHVPKTGGTTLHSVLVESFKSQDVCPERFNKLGNYKAGELAKYKFFSGHYDFISCQIIPGLNKKIFTFLREPKARLISLYYFLRSHTLDYSEANNLNLAILANSHSFCEFLNSEDVRLTHNVFNPYLQLLTGKRPSGEFDLIGNQLVLNNHDKELLEFSKERLLSLSAFGLLERFDDSVELISEELDLHLPKKIKRKMVLKDMVNSGSVHMQQVEKEDFVEEHHKEILFNTYLDNKLYEYAEIIFDKRFKAGQKQSV
jgi:hypothetical protein